MYISGVNYTNPYYLNEKTSDKDDNIDDVLTSSTSDTSSGGNEVSADDVFSFMSGSYSQIQVTKTNQQNDSDTVKTFEEMSFSKEDLLEIGFTPADIAKYFKPEAGNDGVACFKVQSAKVAGNTAVCIESFYCNVISEKIRAIELKYEANAIGFSDITKELVHIGLTNIKKTTSSDGCPVISCEYGGNISQIVNTAPKEVLREWASFFTSNEHLKHFVKKLEKVRGVTEVEYREAEDGLRTITYRIDDKRYSLIQSSAVETKDYEEDNYHDDKAKSKLYLYHLGFNDSEIEKYFICTDEDKEEPENSEYKLKYNIEIDGEKINNISDLQYAVVYKRIRKENQQ